jgi:hypothetical protein
MLARDARPVPLSDSGPSAALGVGVGGLLLLATWALSHSYLGIFHDAALYTLQAAARLHPATLSGDVFLEFGSQDRFTAFSPIYAATSRLLGVEPAAALLTLLFQVGLVVGAWTLIRAVVPGPMALLGVAVLIAIPGDYGADRVFTCIEPFLTPRMAAEALVLGSLAAALHGRKPLMLLLIALATLLHPLMAIAGFGALYGWYVGLPRPRLAAALAIGGLAAVALVGLAMPEGRWGRFDPDWLALVQARSPYLFVSNWSPDDGFRAAVGLATLAIGMLALANGRARILCGLSLCTALGGLALTYVGGDLLHLVLVTQLQPWRCQWLATAVAALMLPQIVRTLWGKAGRGRTALMLLLAAWVFAANFYALVALLAAFAALLGLDKLKATEARWVFYGAGGMLIIALLWRLATDLAFTDAYYLDPGIPLWIRRAMSFARDGSAPVALVMLAWWLAHRRRGRPALAALGVAAAAACAALFPHTLHAWTLREFEPARAAQFAEWRRRIPPGAQIFWPESPLAAWLLLERPSYLSVAQTSGMVFSRRGALELARRAQALRAAINPEAFLGWSGGTGLALSAQQQLRACASGEFEFLVTGAALGADLVATAPSRSGPATKLLRLYRCATHPG